jgi:hypothetical protein
MLADRSGLTGSLSRAFVRRGFVPVHDRGRVLVDAAVAIACGGRDIVDVEALRAQAAVFGPVASDTTLLRALGEIGDARRTAIGRARAAARAHLWSQFPDGVAESRFAGGLCQPGTVVIRIDGSLVTAHSKKGQSGGNIQEDVWPLPVGGVNRQHRRVGQPDAARRERGK